MKTAATAARPAMAKEPLMELAEPVNGVMLGEIGVVPFFGVTAPVPDGAAAPAGLLDENGATGAAGVLVDDRVMVDRIVVGMQVLMVITDTLGAGATGAAGELPAGEAGALLTTGAAGELPAGEAGALLLTGAAGELLRTGAAGELPAGEAGAELAGTPPAAVTGQIVVEIGMIEVT